MPSAIVASSRPLRPEVEQGGDEAAGRRADHQVGRQAVLLERLDHADVGEAAPRAAAQSQADARAARGSGGGGGRRRRRGRCFG